MASLNSFDARSTLRVDGASYTISRLGALAKLPNATVERLPVTLRILLENLLRNEDDAFVKRSDIETLARWNVRAQAEQEIAFRTSRVLLQDFTGVPAVVDLAAMRDAIVRLGGAPKRINPLQPVDLVIDHSVQVDEYGSDAAFLINAEKEFDRNRERYQFLRWGQEAFRNFRVVPPDTGIVHQVNLEYLASVVFTDEVDGTRRAYPDSLVGTDSHTTMINGLGVLGWGVGGIEAEAAMLGQPLSMLIPEVVGFKLFGKLPPGTTATDLVLTVTQMLRAKKVVGKFVEFYGAGLSTLSLADRATIANMAPEYGATVGFFPVDQGTLDYMRFTGRDEHLVKLCEKYYKEQGLFRTDGTPDPEFSDTLQLDLSTVEASLAGPKRPQDRVPLKMAKQSYRESLRVELERAGTPAGVAAAAKKLGSSAEPELAMSAVARSPDEQMHEHSGVRVEMKGETFTLRHGDVVIAAITSCTNTSNPSVMLAAGLLAKNAVERGMKVRPVVKTSLAPGSRVVTEYLTQTGLQSYLDQLGFQTVGYGCTTCIGNSGPLEPRLEETIVEHDLVVASVLSGNRNFEARVHQSIKANFLMSPPLVVAFALAGRVDIDLSQEPIAKGSDGQEVYLRDLWPTMQEVGSLLRDALDPETYRRLYSDFENKNPMWNDIPTSTGMVYEWEPQSTYIQEPPYFENFSNAVGDFSDVIGARPLAIFGDSVTTDHISPAGAIKPHSPAGLYLQSKGVAVADFNSYGARRGNHEVMVRGTFANVRIKNLMVPGVEGGVTMHQPDGERLSIYDAAIKYQEAGVPLIVIAGQEYGTGSSRDWAAKGTRLLGVKAVIAQSFERIHRSNLVGMGVLPCQFKDDTSAASLKLDGTETFDLLGIEDGIEPLEEITLVIHRANGETERVPMTLRIDTPIEVDYYHHGGILPFVLRQLLAGTTDF